MEESDENYDYEKLKEVGKVSYETLQYAKGLVKIGAKVRDVCEKSEEFIRGKGMVPAFPVNVSINQNAAHYTAMINDMLAFSEADLVKIDLGARSDDILGDCAVSVDLSGRYPQLIEAAEEALDTAISLTKAGAKLNSIGKEVEAIANKRKLNPIRNLGGHAIEKGELHASLFVPNFDNGDTTELEEGEVVALETFITDGVGYVVDTSNVQIFQKVGIANPRSEEARKITSVVDNDYKTYPFAVRWLASGIDSEFRIRKGLNELSSLNILESFPTLAEKSNGIVAQAEKEVIVEKDACTVVTK
ncbi:MAG: type II methionyl aminopeptidase [Candidatus Micrarchaeales archaeon]|jgi:methionyl aminopeptidase